MADWKENLINVETAITLDGLFRERVRRSPERTAYQFHDVERNHWQSISWKITEQNVNSWRRALSKETVNTGDRVAISLQNSLEWVFFDQAALGQGLVTVPLYTEDRADNVAYILNDAGVKLLLISNVNQWKIMAPALGGASTLERVLILKASEDEVKLLRDERLMSVESWLAQASPQSPLPRHKQDAEALASIVYTSGTTGRPKGVMLSHSNMLSVAHAALASVNCYEQDSFLSFLPLSHTLERTAGYYLPMMSCSSVTFSRSVAQLAEDLTMVRPTVMIAVPRIFEKIHGRIHQQLEKGSLVSRLLFKATVTTGWRHFERGQGRASWHPGLLFYSVLQKIVARKISEKLGGNLRYAVCGGAALPLPVAQTFIGLGVDILQGYGLTETSPVISVNRPENNDPASVGEPLQGIEVKVAENDELIVHSPGIMMGYWNNHAATAAIIGSDGWLHTGDQARVENRRIYITGRIKDILVLSNGEKVPPGDMESAICLSTLIEQALIVGEGCSFLSAIVVLDPAGWVGLAKNMKLDAFDKSSLADSKLRRKIQSIIQAQLHDFPGYAKVRRVWLSLEPWTIEDGLMTPTQKLKRNRVLKKFSREIEEMYAS